MFVTDPADAFAFVIVFLLKLILKVVLDGETPNLSESKSLDGSKDVSLM